MTFHGRTLELKKLSHFFIDSTENLALVYGRRRVGKSELIKHAIRSTTIKAIYFECKQSSEANNVDSLSVLIDEILHCGRMAFKDFESLLSFLFSSCRTDTTILVLDEYPYLRDLVPGLDSILQALVDQFRDTSKLKIILCGSFIDTMKSLLEYKNPLFGRCGSILHIEPMDYLDSALFYPTFSNEDKVRLYSVFGGIPYYNRLIDSKKSVQENIIDLVASPDARLVHEVPMFLKAELSKINNANAVFETLAMGVTKYKDLLDRSHVSTGPLLIDILNRLIQMGLVKKETPINDESNKKKTFYRIDDNMSRFFYRYVFRHLSQLSMLDSNVFYKRYIDDDFESQFVPECFEEIARQYLIRCNRQGRIDPPFFKIGKFHYDLPKEQRNGEFDVVTEDDRGYICYEAKFKQSALTNALINKEIEQVQQSPINAYRYGFISRAGYQKIEPREELILITLEDLYH